MFSRHLLLFALAASCFFIVIIAVLSTRTEASSSDRSMTLTDTFTASSTAAKEFRSAVIDQPNSAAFFGTETVPGEVCKYSISPTNFAFESCITSPPGIGNFRSAVIDQQNTAAYFGSYTDPGQVCKYNISSTNFSFDSCITSSPGADYFHSAVFEPENSAAFFGTGFDPSQVCKYNVSSTNFALVSCDAAASNRNGFLSAAIDTQNSAAYFGARTNPGQACRYNTSATNFSFDSCIPASAVARNFGTAVIDPHSSVLLFGTELVPAQVCKYSTLPTNFAFVSCIAAPSGAWNFWSSVIDAQNSAAYFGTVTSPGQVCKFGISASSFDSCITAPTGVNQFATAVIDLQKSLAFFVAFTGQARFAKFDLIAFKCSTDGTLIITQDNISDISREINIVALDQCNVTITDVTVGSIGFRGAISDTNITIRNVTCTSESSPFCIKFFEPVTSTSTPDFISISDVTFGVGSFFSSSLVSLLHFPQTLTIPTATFSNLRLQDFATVAPSGDLYVFGLHFEGVVTCPSLSIKDLIISNATVSVAGTTVVRAVSFLPEVTAGSASTVSKFLISIISVLNITYNRTAAGSNTRYLRPIDFRAGPVTDFSSVELSSISVDGIDFGTTSTGLIQLVSIYVTGRIFAPTGSSSANISITYLSTRNIFGEIPSGSNTALITFFLGPNPALRYFARVEISHFSASNITLRQFGSGTVSLVLLYPFSASSGSTSASTSLHIYDVAIHDNVILESTNAAKSTSVRLRYIVNYASVFIENIYVADEGLSLVGTGAKTLTGVEIQSGSSITSSSGSSSSFLIRNITVPSPASTSSAHVSYAKTTDNLFNNVNNFFNVTISQLTYLGEWTVPSNLISSGPVVFSILDSNATNIFFNTPISESNITVSGVTSLCSGGTANCSLIHFGSNSLVDGTWNITSNNVSSLSSHLISAESTSIFTKTLTINLQDNYIDVTSEILSPSPPSFSLNSSTWNLICNHWSRPVYSRFAALVAADSSNPTLNLQTCLLTQTETRIRTESVSSSISLSHPATASPIYSISPSHPATASPLYSISLSHPATASPSSSVSLSHSATPPKPTLFPTTLLAVKTYGIISPNVTVYPSYTPPPTTATGGQVRLEEISGKQSVEEIINVLEESRNGATPPMEVILRSADPGLGTFIVRRDNLLPGVTVAEEKDDEIRFSGTNLTELAIAIKNGYVFAISPEAEARNLTEGQYVEVVAKDGGNQQGVTAIQLNRLEINRGPQPVFPRSANASFNVSRGKRFVLDLNSTFIHRQQLPMSFAAHRADLLPLPRLLRLVCEPLGNCTARGVIDTEDPIELEIQASDGYILNASYVTLVPIVIPVHPDASIELLPLLLRPGQEFLYPLPTNLFISSTDVEYTAVRLATGFLLPRTMVFDPPFFLRGTYNQEGLLHLQVRASDLFAESARNFTLNFTNVQPFCRNDFTRSSSTISNSSVPNIRSVAAFQEFERTIEFRDVCADNDNDPLRFDVNAFELPSWLRFIIQPGGTTILPQILRLSGIPPKIAENSLLLINVTVTDLFSSLILSIPLQIAKNEPPVLIRPLPNYTINPGAVETFTVNIDQHFEDPNEDALTVSTEILTEYAKSWMTVTTDSRNTLTISVKPPDSIVGEDDDAKDADEQLRVTVEDPFGNSTTTIINVYVRLTLWQRVRTVVYIIVGLFSTLLSIGSFLLFYPLVYNFFRAGSKQIECPLNAKNRVWNLPEDASEVQMLDRAQDEFCMSLRNWTRKVSVWAYDQLTLEEFPFGDPPTWVEKLDKAVQLGNIEKEPGTEDQVLKKPVYDFCFVRVYNRRGLVLVQFEMKYHEITRRWDFELIKEERKAAAEKKRKQDQQDGLSEISIDFDDDTFGVTSNINNPGSSVDDERLRNIDTRISSMDVQHDEEMQMIRNENRAMKAKTAKTDQELSSLRSLVQTLLSSSSSSSSAEKKPSASAWHSIEEGSSSVYLPPEEDDVENDDDEQQQNGSQHDYAAFDVYDGMNDVAIDETHHESENQELETEEERLARLEFDDDEKAYRAKGEYDRDLEELLEAGVQKKNEEKEKKMPTFNPITQQLAKQKLSSHTDL